MVVPAREPCVDGAFQFVDGMESAATNHFIGDEAKPTLHLIEPGTASRREMEVETAALPGFEPALDSGTLVSAVVIQNSDGCRVPG